MLGPVFAQASVLAALTAQVRCDVAPVLMHPSTVYLAGVALVAAVHMLTAGALSLQIWYQAARHLHAPLPKRRLFLLFLHDFPSFSQLSYSFS